VQHHVKTGTASARAPAPALAVTLALALTVTAALAAAGCSGDGPAQGKPPSPAGSVPGGAAAPALPVTIEALAPRAVEQASEYVATLSSRRSVTLFPRVTGYVREILVQPGQPVKAGAPMLRIDARQEAAQLAQTQASRRQAETQLELAVITRERSEALYRDGIRSRQDLDNARAQEQAARATVQSARANVKAQSVQVAYHEVAAPFDGRAGDILVKIGDSVGPQTALTQVDESDQLELSVEVPVERAGAARVGQTAVELLDGAGKPLARSKVFFVAPGPDERTQLVELRAAFQNAGALRSGQRVRARVVWATSQALTVPTFAVTRQTGQAFVFRVKQGAGGAVVERHPVKLGALAGDRWIVEAGLEAGDRVAVDRLQALRDGTPVRPVAARPAAVAPPAPAQPPRAGGRD
jgi:RND family efflux transporter MFP subunit